jgi:peptidoglycan/LPS O-acetylase OafA/YrhL
MQKSPVEKTLWNHDHILLLDGLRGVALLMVLAYHFTTVAGIGWAGVDLFLVLSGYLITSKLVEAAGSHHYFRKFYLRRILRIVPLYAVALLVLFVIGPALAPAMVTPSYAESIRLQHWYWTFTQNIYFGLHGWTDNIAVLHYWSLALEMQFYFIWPFVVYLFIKRVRVFVIFLVALLVFAILFRAFAGEFITLNALYHYVLLPSRIDAFAAGALLYVVLHFSGARYRQVLWWIWTLGLLVIVVAYLFFADINYMAGFSAIFGHTLFDVCWAALMGYLLLLPPQVIGNRFLSGRFLVTMGKYSYGMYVVHLPVWIVLTTGVKWMENRYGAIPGVTWYLPVAAFLLTWLLGALSYHGLEKYFLRIKLR